MDEVTEVKALLSLVIAEHPATHKECIRAVSWLPSQESCSSSPDVPVKASDARLPTAEALSYRSSEAAVQAIAISDDLSTWLLRRADPVTNWFVMKGAAFDDHVAALEQHLQVTASSPLPSLPGSYELGGLWRMRPGVSVNIYYPANFDPEDRFSCVAVKVSLRNSVKLLQISGWSFASALNTLLREFIAGGEL